MCPVCRLLLYCSVFGACRGWVTEGQLKKRVRVVGAFLWISLPAWWRDCMWNCSKGNNMLSVLVAWSKVIVSSVVPYSS